MTAMTAIHRRPPHPSPPPRSAPWRPRPHGHRADERRTARDRPCVRLASWIAVLVASHVTLVAAGRVLPAPPDPRQADAVGRFLLAADPARTAFCLLRVAALGITWYLAAITALALVARVLRCRPLAMVADALTLPAARRLLRHVLGAGLALSVAAGGPLPMRAVGAAPVDASGAASTAGGRAQASMQLVADAPADVVSDAAPDATPPVTVRMRVVDGGATTDAPAGTVDAPPVPRSVDTPPATTATTTATATATTLPEVPADRPAPAGEPDPHPTAPPAPPTPPSSAGHEAGGDPAPDGEAPTPSTAPPAPASSAPPASSAAPTPWTIEPGDHLWHVSRETLVAAWSRPPTDQEINRYLQTLIDANRDRLVVRGNPDLVFPGQVFERPPVPAP